MNIEPKIYVGTYAKYNSGSITGKWFDLSDFSDEDEFAEACKELHKDESDPEFMFQDFEGIPDGLASESSLTPEFWEWNELDEDDKKMLFAYGECIGETGEDHDRVRDCFCGVWDSFSDYVYEDFTDCNEIPDHLVHYLDWEKIERDWEMDHSCFVDESDNYNVYVFRQM